MRTIKLFEDWYSAIPQTMGMEDIKKLSARDFIKLAEETVERGKGTDQNEFWTIWRTWMKANPEGKEEILKDEDLRTRIGKWPVDGDVYTPVDGDVKKKEIEKEIERVEGYIKRVKETPGKIEAWYKEQINILDQKKEMYFRTDMYGLKSIPELEKELAELKSEREKIKF